MRLIETSTITATLGLFCFLTASNLASTKAIQALGIHLTAGFFTYPFVYFFSSIIIATRSPKTYFRCITLAYLGYLAFISMMYLASITPDSDPDSSYSQSFNLIYNLSNYRVYLASLCAYFVSTFMFGVIFSSLKINSISIKITISTIIVSLVDVKLFLALAYFGVKDNGILISIMFWSSVTKLVAQLVLLPPAIFIINTIRDRDECYF